MGLTERLLLPLSLGTHTTRTLSAQVRTAPPWRDTRIRDFRNKAKQKNKQTKNTRRSVKANSGKTSV